METNVTPSSSTPPSGGTQPREERIAQLKQSLSEVEVSIRDIVEESKGLTFLSFVFCIAALCITWCVVSHFVNDHDWLKDKSTGLIIYVTATRATAIGAVFALCTFCFKILRSYLNVYQTSREKLMVIRAMASLVESATEYNKRDEVFIRLFGFITQFKDTGLLYGRTSESPLYSDTLKQIADVVLKTDKKD
jgi:hypothetical protein